MNISIIMATYNSEKTIKQAIKSILEQTYNDYELIIVDGDSTDKTCDIINKFNSKKINFVSESDSGVYEAFNKGLKMATGNWIFFIGSDDVLYNVNSLEYIDAILDLKYDLIYTKVKIGDREFKPKFNSTILFKNMIHHQGAMYNRRLFDDFIYDERYKISADYELNLKLFINKNKVKYLNEFLSTCGEDGLSGVGNYLGYKEEIEIRDKLIENYFLKLFLAICTHIRMRIKNAINYKN